MQASRPSWSRPAVCSANDSFVLALAVNTWDRQTHANAPASFEWQIDTDGDGEADFFIFNADLALNLSDGRNVSWVQAAGSTTVSPLFFTDHATNSANTTLLLCAEDIGLTGDDFFTPLTADLLAVDTYFMGRVTDVILDIEFSPLGERFFPVIDGGFGAGVVPAGDSVELTALDFGVDGHQPQRDRHAALHRRHGWCRQDRVATGQRGPGGPRQLGPSVR